MGRGPECPYCGSARVDAEFGDIGVGFQQVTPYQCEDCEALQMAPHQFTESIATEEERRVGWFRGPEPPNPYAVDPDRAHLAAVRAGMGGGRGYLMPLRPVVDRTNH